MSDPKHRLLTIITANYNSGKKLIETCASIAGQNVDYEHLIMDGISTDGSLELARQLAAEDPRIKVHFAKDRGPYDAFNKGIELATGDYIYFLGAGDVVFPNRLGEIAAYFPKNLASFVYGDCMLDRRRYDGKFTRRKLIDKNICHQGAFYGRECFKICGIYDLKYRMISDLEFNMRCFGTRRIKKIYVPIVIAKYEGGGISAKPDAAFGEDQSMLIRKHFGLGMVFRMKIEHYIGRIRGRFGREMQKWKKS